MNKLYALFEPLGESEKLIAKTTIISSFHIYLIIFILFPSLITLDIFKIIVLCLSVALILNLFMFIMLSNSFKKNYKLAYGVILGLDTFYTFFIIFGGVLLGIEYGILTASIIILILILTVLIIHKSESSNSPQNTERFY